MKRAVAVAYALAVFILTYPLGYEMREGLIRWYYHLSGPWPRYNGATQLPSWPVALATIQTVVLWAGAAALAVWLLIQAFKAKCWDNERS
jgi:hypothetical protein